MRPLILAKQRLARACAPELYLVQRASIKTGFRLGSLRTGTEGLGRRGATSVDKKQGLEFGVQGSCKHLLLLIVVFLGTAMTAEHIIGDGIL